MAVTIDTGNIGSSNANAFLGGNASVRVSLTCGALDNFLVVGIVSATGSGLNTISSVTYNSVALTLLSGSDANLPSGGPGILDTAIYYMANPPTGAAHNLDTIWSVGGGQASAVLAIPMSGVDATGTPFGTPVTATSAANNNPAVTGTGANSSGLYLATMINGQATSTVTGANQTNLVQLTENGNTTNSADTVGGSHPGVFSWTGAGTIWGVGWAAVAVAINAPPSATVLQVSSLSPFNLGPG